MKDFIKFTFASTLGVVLAGVILTILGIVTIVGMVGIVASHSTETIVKENSILWLKLDGNLYERVEENPFESMINNSFKSYGLNDILTSIQKAKDDKNIKGIYLEAGLMDAAYASLEEIRCALKDFKECGKFIVAYGDNYSQGMYYLASVADKVIVNPQGTIAWQGLSSQTIFFKDILEKVGVEMEVFKVGTYKAAVEPFIATEMSNANREQITAFLNSTWKRLLEDISASRGMSEDDLNKLADECMAFSPAETYINNGLADTLLYNDGVINYLKLMSGCKADETLHILSLDAMKNVKFSAPIDMSGNKIAVYYAFGEIAENSLLGDGGILSTKVVRDLRKLREDESVKAVVLRVNSPGGSAYGSEQIWREVTLLKEKKPVVVSMGDYAASGGYYISCAANRIVADPTTLTGSIGIFGMFPMVEDLLTDKLGLHIETIKTNRFADMGDMKRPFNAAERVVIQNYINNGYKLFVQRCADGRGMSVEAIEKIAEGRVWTGTAAKDLGLVDELGGLDKAIEIAAELAAVETYSIITPPEGNDIFSSLLKMNTIDYLEDKVSESLGEYYDYAKFIQGVKSADRIQARMPFELRIR